MLCKTEPVAKMEHFSLLALGGCAENFESWHGVGVNIGACYSNSLWERFTGHSGDFAIVSGADGLCLDHDLGKVILRYCHGGDNQKWTWTQDHAIRNTRDGNCLEVQGHRLEVSPCRGKPSQKFVGVPKEIIQILNLILERVSAVLFFVALFVIAKCLISCCKGSRQSGERVQAQEQAPCRQSGENVQAQEQAPCRQSGENVQAQEQAPINTWESKAEQKLDALEKMMATIGTKMTHMTTVLEGQGTEDSCSDCTVGSWTHVTEEPCCFVPDTFLKKAADVGHEFVLVQNLSQGDQVVAANGTVIEVLRPPEQHRVHAVIELQAGPSCLIVTPDHRIVIPGNKTVQAKDLEVGCDVLLDQTRARLTSLEWRLGSTMVLKISFSPDLPVAGFLRPPAILSKGTREKPVVRRGTRKPGKVEDNPTIPDTEPPLTP